MPMLMDNNCKVIWRQQRILFAQWRKKSFYVKDFGEFSL